MRLGLFLPVVSFALIAGGLLTGGPLVWGALVWISLAGVLHDRLSRAGALRDGLHPDALPRAVALCHAVLLPLAVVTLSQPGGLGGAERVAGFLAAGLWFGQIANATAHELIHRSARGDRRLGTWVYISLAFGHHASAHPKVHHVHVATDADPNSARLGESVWRFLPRAWVGSFREGLRAETRARERAGAVSAHPYLAYVAGPLALAGIALATTGAGGLAIYLGLAVYAQAQLLLTDYVQHYGLRRARRPDGNFEPAGPAHSWNAAGPATSTMLMNAPRHSDHHQRPARPFGALDLPAPADAPRLPATLPTMAALALWPPAWRRVMDPRAKAWGARSDAQAEEPLTGA